MIKFIVSIGIIFQLFSLIGQTEKELSESIGDCEGAVNLVANGSYSVQFPGKPGYVDDLLNYPSLSGVSGKNTVWISYTAESDGIINMSASVSDNYLQMIVFEENTENICSDLSRGTAKIARIYKNNDRSYLSLDSSQSGIGLTPLKVSSGKKIMIAFTTLEKTTPVIKLNFNYSAVSNGTKIRREPKILDNRSDKNAPSLNIIARDKITKEPVTANFIIEDNKEMAGLYRCSDLLINPPRACRINIRCDAEGYFFDDKQVSVTGTTNQEIVFYLDHVAKGKSIRIEEIAFVPGSSDILPGSEAKLKRLKDFMALNSEVEIEIQGHVFMIGDNGFSSQRLSEARAKKVMSYLVDNGINKQRMQAVGYGNTRPIYPEPKVPDEEQANRRVEILVK
jgi:outer membrane protein OmpA-like peptidoglycan-associated protein